MVFPFLSTTEINSGLKLTKRSNLVIVGSLSAESNKNTEEGIMSLSLVLTLRNLKDKVLIVIFFLFF